MALRLDRVDVLDDVGVVQLLEKVDLTLHVQQCACACARVRVCECVLGRQQRNALISRI